MRGATTHLSLSLFPRPLVATTRSFPALARSSPPTMFRVATLLLALAASVSAGCVRQYTVKPGDICDSISAENHVSTFQLSAINPQINDRCFNLMPGETLCLGTVHEDDCKQTYIVKPNDSCETIQNAAGINATLLHTNNPQIDDGCGNLYIGQVLCTANAVRVPPVPADGIPTAAISSSTLVRSSTSASAAATSLSKSDSASAVPTSSSSSASRSVVLVTQTVTSGSAAATPTKSAATPTKSAAADEDVDTSGDPNDETLPYCDEL